MDARGLKQDDLSSVAPPRNLSEILVEKRKISATLAGEPGKFLALAPLYLSRSELKNGKIEP